MSRGRIFSCGLVRVALLAAMLLFSGCTDLQTGYGERMTGSINGWRVLRGRFAEEFALREVARLDQRTAEVQMVVHVAENSGLPDPEAVTWLEQWLSERPRRQAVLILRDGTMTAWLCRRWAEELRVEMATADAQRKKILIEQIKRLEECTLYDSDTDFPFYVLSQESGPLRLEPTPVFTPTRLDGLVAASAPPFLQFRQRLSAPLAQVLATVATSDESRPWAVSIPYGGSRLVVVASALPFLDAAQVDHTCRRLLTGLLDALRTFAANEDTVSVAWVRTLATGPVADPPAPNILAMLFGRPPFNYVVFHLLALVLVLIGGRMLWLGRTEAPARGDLQRFGRHVAAFADHLRRARATSEVLTALAAVLRRPPPTEDARADAFAAARALYVKPQQGPPHV